MGKEVEIKHIIVTDAVGIYTFQFTDKPQTEFADFMCRFKDVEDRLVKDDFRRIITMIDKISKEGAYERLFRTNEGKIRDNVVAIPLDILPRKNHDTLRLYCVRLSDQILIIGNGGTKQHKYNGTKIEQYTHDLANLEQAINKYIRKNRIVLDCTMIIIDKSIRINI